MNLTQTRLAILVWVALALSCVHPPFPREMFLQHSPTVLCLLVAPRLCRRVAISNAASICLALFLLLHILGARYIYSYVPYDDWSQRLLGVSLTETFHFRRNHYDRLVHFAFGALWVLPVREVCVRAFGVPRRFAYYAAFEFTLAFSMVYELFEWGVSVVLSPGSADAYNGQQGDMWDAQKDMSCALIGAAAALLILALRRRRNQA